MKTILAILLCSISFAQAPLPTFSGSGGGGGGGTPGGSNTQCQYNNSSAFGGITGCTTNGTAVTLVAPVLGTPASGDASNLTNIPVNQAKAGAILPVANGGTAIATTLSQIPYCPDTSSSTTTYTATCSPAPPSLVTGMLVTFVPANSNTAASTLAIGALGAKAIIAGNTTGSALVADDLLISGAYTLEYDGTSFRKINGPDGPWTGMAAGCGGSCYSNSWADFGSSYQVGQYRKLRNGDVQIRATLAAGTLTSGTTIITMPAGYRTTSKTGYGAAGGNVAVSGYAIGQLDFQTSGAVSQTSNGGLFQAGGPWIINFVYSVY